ncbi:MAG: hypothetical protein JNJ54_24985 [Myxococcaceae bacterium]|nr:hypothetical protein [Myxococcaceae bacterium]
MGARLSFPGARLVHTLEPGVFVECEPNTGLILRRLELAPDNPLYPVMSRDDAAPRAKRGQPPAPVRLLAGQYYVETFERTRSVRHLAVGPDDARWTTELEVLEVLGALEALRALGLDDAAVALVMGDLDAARVQWLRWRDGP